MIDMLLVYSSLRYCQDTNRTPTSGNPPTTHLGEIANQVATLHVILRQHIEEKWLHIIIERLVIQEEFC